MLSGWRDVGEDVEAFRDATRCGDDVAAGPLIELGTASESAGESRTEEPSACCADTDAEESIGLVTDGCVRLGDDVIADTWSGASEVVDIDGAGGTTVELVDAAGAVDVADADGCCCDGVATPAAAAVAYRRGPEVVRAAGEVIPALSTLDIGCCAKFGFGGGLAANPSESLYKPAAETPTI